MTEAELAAHRARLSASRLAPQKPVIAKPSASLPRRAKQPNKTELLYARIYLEPRKLAGEIQHYEFEALTLVLPGGVRYTPDWYAVNRFGRVELHEIKGPQVWDDSIAKLKIAAAYFPFRFTLAKHEQGAWTLTGVGD